MDRNSLPLAQKFIVGRFINILKSPPATYVVNEDGLIGLPPSNHIVEELRETISVLENQATLSSIGVGLNNREVIFLRIRLHGGGLKR
jgi:hypothetical protein